MSVEKWQRLWNHPLTFLIFVMTVYAVVWFVFLFVL